MGKFNINNIQNLKKNKYILIFYNYVKTFYIGLYSLINTFIYHILSQR